MVYAGAQPASLFVSKDRGETWTINESLYDHPHRGQFNPGAGGLCLHTIIPDPSNLQRMYIAISAGGCYRTDDGGLTWTPRNKGVRAEYNPDPYPGIRPVRAPHCHASVHAECALSAEP